MMTQQQFVDRAIRVSDKGQLLYRGFQIEKIGREFLVRCPNNQYCLFGSRQNALQWINEYRDK